MKPVCMALIAAACLAFGTASQAAAEDVAVIVNKSNPVTSFTITDLRNILLGPRPKWSTGMNIIVLMTKPGQPERSATIKVVCGMNETDFMLHFVHTWRKVDGASNGNNGDLPEVFTSGAQLRQSVAKTPNAVGFIKASEVDDSVKVVAVDTSSPGQPAYKLKMK